MKKQLEDGNFGQDEEAKDSAANTNKRTVKIMEEVDENGETERHKKEHKKIKTEPELI